MFGLGIYFVLLILTAAVMGGVLWMDLSMIIWEGCLISSLLVSLMYFRSVRGYFFGLPKSCMHFLTVFLFLVIVGHILGKSRTTFPFVTWSMLAKIEDTDAYYLTFDGIDPEGRSVRIDPAKLFPGLEHGRVRTGWRYGFEALKKIERSEAEALQRTPGSAPSTAIKRPIRILTQKVRDAFEDPAARDRVKLKAELNQSLLAMIKKYNQEHIGSSIRGIVVLKHTPMLDHGDFHVTSEKIWQVNYRERD